MLAFLVANLKMMVRDRQTLFWALTFPLIFVVVFGLFDVGGSRSVDLAIIDHADSSISRNIRSSLTEIEILDIHTGYANQDEAHQAVKDGDLEYLLVIPGSLAELGMGTSREAPISLTLYYDQANLQENQLVEGVIRQFLNDVNLELADVDRLVEVSPQPVNAGDVEYFDILLIGLVGMAVMFNSIIVIAVKISMYRNQAILKRILVTPLRVSNYFASEILAHLLLATVQAVIIVAVGVLLFGASIPGNIGWLLLIIALGGLIFLNIGFAISGWADSPAAASGLGNVIVLPMMFFSGTFFSTSSLPSFLPDLVQVLPMTPMLDAMRGVALDGQEPWEMWREVSMLAGWLVVSSAAAIKFFRFA